MEKYILLTGASGSIGRAIALKLAQSGYSLYLHYNKNRQSIESLLEELKPFCGTYIPLQAELSDQDAPKKIASQIMGLDGIIHNAGHSHYGLLQDLDPEEANKLIQVHVMAPLMLTKELVPRMISKKSGAIVVVSSIWGQTGAAFEVAYSTVKGAQIGFVKSLAKELAPSGITVNAIAPGAVESRMMADFTVEELEVVHE